MNNEFNNQNVNETNVNLNTEEVNIKVLDNKNINSQHNNDNDSGIPVIIMIIILMLFVFVFLGNDDNLFSNDNKQENGGNIVDSNKDDKLEDSQVNKNDDNKVNEDNNIQENKNDKVQEENNKLNYEINTEVDSSTGVKKHYLYLNGKKVYDIKADEELGSIEVKEFKDLLIVDEQNPGPSRKLFVVDKNGNSTEIDYKVSTYNTEFINTIDSYRVKDNNLYIKVNRQWGNGYIDWYCRYEDKNEVAEYEVKYEYVNGKLENKQVLNEVTIANKYKNESCMNDNRVCEGYRDAVYHGEYHEMQGIFSINIDTTLTLRKDGTYFWEYKNGGPNQGTYTLVNNKLIISGCPDVGGCDEKFTITYAISSDCSTIIKEDYNLYLK